MFCHLGNSCLNRKNYFITSYQVLDTLTSSKELIGLLKNVDSIFHSSHAGSSKSMLSSLHRYVPAIREQLQASSFVSLA